MTLIALDLGTSFIKGAVLDLDQHRIDHIQRVPFPEPITGLNPLFREYDTDQLMAAVRTLLDQLARVAGSPEGLVMCSQMHCTVFTTRQGEARSNLLTWQDQRTLMPHSSGEGSYFDVLMNRITPVQKRQLGHELRVGHPIGLYTWLVDQGQVPDEDVIPASITDFVAANLCGVAPVVGLTHASAYGLLNLETLDWHHELIADLGIEAIQLPDIRQQGDVVGTVNIGGNDVPCYVPVGDYQCAIAGTLLNDNELSLNISTGSQVSLIKNNLELGDYQTRPFFDGRFLNTVTTIPAGRSLSVLVNLFSELATAQGVTLDDPWSYIIEAASQIAQTEMQVNLSFYSSAVGDRGEITNIHESELTVGHIFRAAFQNMADNYYACALRVSPEQAWDNLVVSGGLAQKIEMLRDLIAARFDRSYRVCRTSEDTFLGLIALGMAITGRVSTVAEAMEQLRDIDFD